MVTRYEIRTVPCCVCWFTPLPQLLCPINAAKLERRSDIGKEFFEALITLDPNAEEGEIRQCRIEDLVPGMIIQQEVRTPFGSLLVSKGQEVTAPLVVKLKNSCAQRAIGEDVSISMPTTTLALAKGAT